MMFWKIEGIQRKETVSSLLKNFGQNENA